MVGVPEKAHHPPLLVLSASLCVGSTNKRTRHDLALMSNSYLAPAPGETGIPSSALNSYGVQVAGGDGVGNDTYPKAFVTILLFDNDYNFVDIAYEQVDGGEEDAIGTPVAHDHMMRMYTVKEPGYAFMFISNENPTEVQVYFDDVTMTHTPTNIIQYNEYYPFGLQASTSWTRENNSNPFLYNEASELNNTSGWYDLPFRNYDAALGRFMQVDPLAHVDNSKSPFAYAGNNPASFNDPLGLLVSAGYTDSQLHTMHRRDRYEGGPVDFGDWAQDNIEGFGAGGRIFQGTDGRQYGFNENGEFGRWSWFGYKYFYEDGVEAEWMQHEELEWVALDDGGDSRTTDPNPWDLVGRSTMFLLRMALNMPDAVSMGMNVDGVVGVGVDATPRSILLVMTGVDRGKSAPIGDAGFGIGLNTGAAFSLTEYYYFDPTGKRPFEIGDFAGLRFSAGVDVNILGPLEVGVGLSIAPIVPSEGIYMIGVTKQYGVSPPTSAPISGDVNFGWTWFYKK